MPDVRLIDANVLMKNIGKIPQLRGITYGRMKKAVEETPTIDAVPVVHGRWIDEIEPNAVTASGREVHIFRCSACDFTWANTVLLYFKHCPNCGAKLDEKEGSHVPKCSCLIQSRP